MRISPNSLSCVGGRNTAMRKVTAQTFSRLFFVVWLRTPRALRGCSAQRPGEILSALAPGLIFSLRREFPGEPRPDGLGSLGTWSGFPCSCSCNLGQISSNSSINMNANAFPSFCFALATGVGKTRLMGAFISYLHLAHGINNFFVLAPNLTIYNKLIADFTPNTPKYVFSGIAGSVPCLVSNCRLRRRRH